jgi:hypothetical protein
MDPDPRTDACEYDSCPADTNTAIGNNATDAMPFRCLSLPPEYISLDAAVDAGNTILGPLCPTS